MIIKRLKLLIIIAVLLFTACASSPADTSNATSDNSDITQFEAQNTNTLAINLPSAPAALPNDNLRYLGAFRLPEDGENEEHMFSWGGEALAYNPNNNSLFIVGHNWYTNISEISIPTPVISRDLSQLNQSEIIQEFKNIKGNNFSKWDMEIPRVGIEVIEDKLYYCFGQHYEEDTNKGTHGYCDLQLNPNDAVCMAGDYLYATNDYLFAIPKSWQEHFGGNNLLTGRFRDGGWSGMGPSIFTLSSVDIVCAKNNESIGTRPVLRYNNAYNGYDGPKMNDYSHADSITGGAFVDCDLGSSIVFTATHGFGSTWYGFSNGVVYPTEGDANAVYPDVPPYPHDERGWWNDDFRAALIMYDPAHLASVYRGEFSASSPQPYAIVDLTEYMLVARDETCMVYLGGCGYDSVNVRLYVLELFADGDKPVVHVFTFN